MSRRIRNRKKFVEEVCKKCWMYRENCGLLKKENWYWVCGIDFRSM